MTAPRIVVLAGGVGGAKFVRGVRALCRERWPDGPAGTAASITVVVNTGDDLWLAGLRVTPDLDSVMYALAGVNDDVRGWGRAGETERVSAELTAYGVGWPWFTLGDLDLGTHIARSAMLRDGLPLSAVTERLTARWPLGVRLLPMTDAEVETHVVVDEDGEERELHFEEWWVRTRAALTAKRFVQHGVAQATPAPGVVEATGAADVILLAPSNPVVSIGTILGIPGIREALRSARAPVVGVSPVIGGAVVRGMADACLTAIGVATDAAAIALHYGARGSGGLLDGWLVDEVDTDATGALNGAGVRSLVTPLWMTDDGASAIIVAGALGIATAIAREKGPETVP
ncbi:2-phospho-L-lactate transferase [uncultured Amnibacterium sp.]|uniref:2-phospho-L-lactate transferase n=1 Tax=uncultured Amnibacterium sp. TaxID=1631851 RepID=UPI0035CC1CD4